MTTDLVLHAKLGDPSERLSCLLCGRPTADETEYPSCEFQVTFLVPNKRVTCGLLHRACLERNQHKTPNGAGSSGGH